MTPARVAVCVATFRRPAGLARLLDALARQRLRGEPAASFEVFVVDNDAEGSARPVCEGRAGVTYAVEERRGIPQARNKGMGLARESAATHVAFIDDDEEPAEDWLDRLLEASRAWRAEIVQGRVIPRFRADVPAWITRDPTLFESLTAETGDVLPYAATNATLASMEVFDLAGEFEESWALSGGTDSLLFGKAVRAGLRAVWCDEAVVHEDIGAERATLAWVCRRAFRVGITQSRVRLALSPDRGRLSYQRRLGARTAVAGLRRLLPWSGSPTSPAVSARMACFGAGIALGAFGVSYEEYSRR